MKVRYFGTLLPKIYSNLVFHFATEVVDIKIERPWYEGSRSGAAEVCSDLECDTALLGDTRLSDRHAVTYLKTRVLKWMSNQVSSRIPENIMYLPFHLIRRVNKTTIFYVISLVLVLQRTRIVLGRLRTAYWAGCVGLWMWGVGWHEGWGTAWFTDCSSSH